MKKYLLLLFVLIAFGACKKDAVDPQPVEDDPTASTSLAAKVVGKYKLQTFRYLDGDLDLDFTKIPSEIDGIKVTGGTIVLEEGDDENMIELTSTIKIQGQDDVVFEYELEVRKKGKSYALYSGNYQAAECDGSTVAFEAEIVNSQTKKERTIGFSGKK